MTGWTFSISSAGLTLLAVAWLAGAWLSWLQWRRRHGRAVLFLESLRLLALGAVLFTLAQPERTRREEITDPPEIVILADGSESMETLDLSEDEGTLVTRADWLEERLATNFWSPLETGARVTIQHFARPEGTTNEAATAIGTDLDRALREAHGTHPHLKAILLLSDGDWNEGPNPWSAAGLLRREGIPVFAVGLGREEYLPDLVLEPASVPSYGLLGEQISIPFRVRSYLNREIKTTLRLRGERDTNQELPLVIPAYGQAQDAFVWQPRAVGAHNLELTLPLEPDEFLTDNNDRSFRVEVRMEKLKVLIIDSWPRWEFRFLRNALERDPGVEVHCLLYHPGGAKGEGRGYLSDLPRSPETLSQYDVVFLGDVGLGDGELEPSDADLLRGLVEQQAAGLVFLPGRRGRQASMESSSLADLLPVTLDAAKAKGWSLEGESPLLLTSSGQEHFLTRLTANAQRNEMIWRQLPGFYWSAAVLRARPGADVLAVHGSLRAGGTRMPLLVARPYGHGEVLFLGMDGAWRWRRGVEDTYHYRFWGQVVRWMAHRRHMSQGDGYRLSYSPENPSAGQAVYLQVALTDMAGTASPSWVQARLKRRDAEIEALQLEPLPGGWGVYEGTFTPREGGDYQINLSDQTSQRKLQATLRVAETRLEKIGQPANLTMLRELAAMTGGNYGNPQQLGEVVRQMNLLPETEPREFRFRLWSNPWWGGLVLLLLGFYWAARKAVGMF